MLGYRMVKIKNYGNMLSHFHLMPERHGRTDGRTDRQTDRIVISISRVSVLTRDKNGAVRQTLYDFLWVRHCNYSSRLYRLRVI